MHLQLEDFPNVGINLMKSVILLNLYPVCRTLMGTSVHLVIRAVSQEAESCGVHADTGLLH